MLELLVIVVVLLALITGIVIWASGGKSGGSGEMACGACGYAVRGLTQLNCPECGVDLREAGINKLGSPNQRRVGVAITFGSVAFILMMVGMLFFLSAKNVSSSAPIPASISQPAPYVPPPTPPVPNGPTKDTDAESGVAVEQPQPEEPSDDN